AIAKQMNGWSYRELSFHLADSTTYRAFCGLGLCDEAPTHSTLQRNIKAITDDTWRAINGALLQFAKAQGVEDGRKIRIDGTVTATNVHAPTDSSLLNDAVRVLTRLMVRAREDFGIRPFPDRTKRANRRALEVLNTKGRKRTKAYRDLLKVTRESVGYSQEAAAELEKCREVMAPLLARQIEHYVRLANCVIDQTERRVLHGEAVPAEEKIFSIFEEHTDIIIKDRRDTHYGHKLTIACGRSGLVLDWVVEDGNPADSTLALRMLERQKEIYGRAPRQAALDGGYASKANLQKGKELGVQDLVFSKKRGLEVSEMAKSYWVFKRLRNFRAGIEGWISYLKRSFGLDRCNWRGWPGFHRYTGASIIAANLLILARALG